MSCLFVYNKISGGEKEIKHHEYIVNKLKEIYDDVDLFESGPSSMTVFFAPQP